MVGEIIAVVIGIIIVAGGWIYFKVKQAQRYY